MDKYVEVFAASNITSIRLIKASLENAGIRKTHEQKQE